MTGFFARFVRPLFRIGLGAALLLSVGAAFAQEHWCEGVDDNGNGEIDEGCGRVCANPYLDGTPVVVAPASVGATAVSLARAGTGFGWVYADTRSGTSQVYAQVTATSGAADKAETRISDGTDAATSPRIVWRVAAGYGVVWVDQRDGNSEVYFRALDANGAPTGSAGDIDVSSSTGESLNPDVVWTGSEFGVVWDDVKGKNRDIYFRRLASDGTPLGQAVRVTSDASLQELASITWDGTDYGIAWTDERDGNREIYARLVDATGSPVGGEVRITTAAGVSERPVIRALKSGDFGIAWQDARSGTDAIWYGRWMGPGYAAPAGVIVNVGNAAARDPSLTTTGQEMLVAWQDSRNGAAEVYLRRLDADGATLSPEVRMTTGASVSALSTAWHGSGTGIAYIGSESGAVRPTLVLAGCGGSDADTDGFTLATGDCNDANALQSPAQTEVCDALDNNCDGVKDETCRGTCDANLPTPKVDVYASPQGGSQPQLAADGQGYGVSWDEKEIVPGCCLATAPYFRKVDREGTPVAPAYRLAPANRQGGNTTIAWNGTEYGVAWQQYDVSNFITKIMFQRIDASGTPIGAPVDVSGDPPLGDPGYQFPVLQWRQGEWGLMFLDFRSDGQTRAYMFVRLDAQGRPLERPRDVTPLIFPAEGDMKADATGYGIAFIGNIDPYFCRIDKFGGEIGSAIPIKEDALDQGFTRLDMTPWGYGVVWTEETGAPGVIGNISYQRIASDGSLVGSPVNVTPWTTGSRDGQPPRIVWTGNEFMLVYYEFEGGARVIKIRYSRFDASGAVVGGQVSVNEETEDLPSGQPAVAWDGERPFVAWSDSSEGGLGYPRIVTSYLTCCEDVPRPAMVGGVGWTDPSTLTWPTTGAARYDRVRGNLIGLRATQGDFSSEILDCQNDLPTNSSTESDPLASGAANFFLVRGDGVCGAGTYDDGSASQQGSRDPGIANSPNACP